MAEVDLSQGVMVWESVFTVNEKVKATALVLFFTAKCKKFDVKILESEVMEYRWKYIRD